MKKIIVVFMIVASFTQINAQKLLPFKLQDTGQTTGYSATQGEDSDFALNTPS